MKSAEDIALENEEMKKWLRKHKISQSHSWRYQNTTTVKK